MVESLIERGAPGIAGRRLNGVAAAGALQAHFARVGRAEVERLRRKLGTLDADQRATAEAVIGQVIEALAASPARALAAQPKQNVVDTVVHLFGLTRNDHER